MQVSRHALFVAIHKNEFKYLKININEQDTKHDVNNTKNKTLALKPNNHSMITAERITGNINILKIG